MKLNHLHVSVPDVPSARAFYEDYFGFRFAFEENAGALVFLRDAGGFLLTLHALAAGEEVAMPGWFHFGFCVDSAARVRELYGTLRAGGVTFAKELHETAHWSNFYCWAPGPYRLEISWDQNAG